MARGIQLVENDSLRVTDSGYEIKLRLIWYRSLPLSCIDRLQLKLDGQLVDPASMQLGINERKFRLDELADLVEEFWFIQDSLSLYINQPGKVEHGTKHNIELELAVRAPYIPIGPGKFLTILNKYSAAQVAG